MTSTVVAIAALLFGLLAPGGTFVDDDGSVHEGSIEAIAAAGITRGCNPPVNDRFCPRTVVTREVMAAFLSRALDLPKTNRDAFVDDDGSLFSDDINRLFAAGITRGCNPPANDRFCPQDEMTRGAMAAMLSRAFGYPPSTSKEFVDDDGHVFEDAIGRIAGAGVTVGCNPPANDRFCPDAPVTREMMATFLTRALGLAGRPPDARCPTFPPDDVWNTAIDHLPVDALSDQYVASIGAGTGLRADFGSGSWPPGSGSPIGIPFIEVDAGTPGVPIVYDQYGGESDQGPFPVPLDAPIEGGPSATGDRHVIVVDRFRCELFELFGSRPGPGASWTAASGARFALDSSTLRPDGWTSADAAGLPIIPGLVRFDDVASGVIAHALRFTAPHTQKAHVWPARHDASSSTSILLPPMGQRFRLKAGFDVSGYSADVRVILAALKRYGMILADNGSPWYVSGAPDSRWDNDVLRELGTVPGSAFEAVDASAMVVDENSGTANQP